jgi:phage tail-like protein
MGLRFEIEIGGISEGFESADVPKTTVAPATYAHGKGKEKGSNNPHAYVRPGLQTNEPFRLSRNFIGYDPLWQWRKKIVDGIKAGQTDYKKTGNLTQYDHDGTTVLAEWDFEGAWISEWVIDPDLDAAGNEILKEQIVVVADVLVAKLGGGGGGSRGPTRHPLPYANNKFRVDIEGRAIERVKKISGLDSKTEVVTVRAGAHDNKQQKAANPKVFRPGKTTYTDLTIERYMVDRSPVLKDWWDLYRKGKMTPRSGSVFILNDDYSDGPQLDFFGAIPKDYNAGHRASLQDDYPTETLVLQIEQLTKNTKK